MTPAEMLSEPLLSKQEIENMLNDINQIWSMKYQCHEEIENMLNDINQSEPLLSKEELEYLLNDTNQVWSRQCQSHEIFVADNCEVRTAFDMYLIANNIGVMVLYDPRPMAYRYSFDTYEGYCKALEFNFDKTGVNIFGGYSEDLCENENEQAMFDAAYAYGWE